MLLARLSRAEQLRQPNLAGLQRFNDGGGQVESYIRGFVDRGKVLPTYSGPTRTQNCDKSDTASVDVYWFSTFLGTFLRDRSGDRGKRSNDSGHANQGSQTG